MNNSPRDILPLLENMSPGISNMKVTGLIEIEIRVFKATFKSLLLKTCL